MNALYIKDLARKTHRGLEGRVKNGKSAGGNAFGYTVLRRIDHDGEVKRIADQLDAQISGITELATQRLTDLHTQLDAERNIGGAAYQGVHWHAIQDQIAVQITYRDNRIATLQGDERKQIQTLADAKAKEVATLDAATDTAIKGIDRAAIATSRPSHNRRCLIMRPNTSVYLVASLASSFLTPRVARVVAVAILLGLTGLLLWILRSDAVVLGYVTDTLTPGIIPDALANVAALPALGETRTLRIAPDLFQALALHPGDLILAFGDPDATNPAQIFDVSALQSLPIATYQDWVRSLFESARVGQIHPAGIGLILLALVAFARFALRLGAGAIMAVLAGITAFITLTLNLQANILPMPAVFLETGTLAAAVVGGVIGYKSLLRTRTLWGERLTATLLSLALIPLTATVLPAVPPILFAGLPLLAQLFPEAIPLVAAFDLGVTGLHLDLNQAAVLLLAIIALRMIIALATHHRSVGGFAQTTGPAGFTPRPDGRHH